MKTTALLGLVLFAVTGCVRSLSPIYTDADLVQDPAFNGRWVAADDDATMDVRASEDGKGYSVVYREGEDASSKLTAHLTKIDDRLFADLTVADEAGIEGGDFAVAHVVPVHSFYLVRLDGDVLVMQTIDSDWLTEYLKQHPDAIPHQAGDGQHDAPLLTGSTEQVRTLLSTIMKDPASLTDESRWNRAPTTAPTTQDKD